MGIITQGPAPQVSVRGFIAEEAVAYGLNEAIILDRIRYWLTRPTSIAQERVWVYGSYAHWLEQFSWWGKNTLIRALDSCEKQGLIVSAMMLTPAGMACKHYRLADSQAIQDDDAIPILGTEPTHFGYVQSKDSVSNQSLANRTPAKRRSESVKPSLPDLETLEEKIPEEAKIPWQCYKVMQGDLRKNRRIAVSVLVGMLTQLLDKGYPPVALAYGLDAATRAEVKAINYVHRAAENYKPPPEQTRNSRPTPRSLEHEVITYAK